MKSKHQYSGFPDDCSPEQLQILAKFRQEVRDMGCSDPPYDDPYLLRFLRARKFNLAKTLVMWKNFIKWRKENNVDDIMNAKFPEMEEARKYYPHGYFRTDKLGRPIYIERIGLLKFEQLVKVIPLEKLQMYFVQSYERLIHEIFPACSKAAGKRVEQTCYIIDLKGAGIKVFPKLRDIIKLASAIGQDYYPEILGTMFIINAPMMFSGIWSIIKHFIDEKTRKKILILDSKYQKELFQYAAVENLPDFLGGRVTSADYGDPFCKEQGPWTESENLKSLDVLLKQDVFPRERVQEGVYYREEQKGIERGEVVITNASGYVQGAVYQTQNLTMETDNTKFENQNERVEWTWELPELPEVAEEKMQQNQHPIRDFNRLLSFEKHRINAKRKKYE